MSEATAADGITDEWLRSMGFTRRYHGPLVDEPECKSCWERVGLFCIYEDVVELWLEDAATGRVCVTNRATRETVMAIDDLTGRHNGRARCE